MRFKLLTMFVGLILILASCKSEADKKADENLDPNTHRVKVEEVLQTKAYTYLRVTEDDTENWLAISQRKIETGEILYYKTGLEMKNFESKDLGRTFETIYFVDAITDKPITKPTMAMPKSPYGKKEIPRKEGISISPVKGGVSIEEVFSKRDSYEGQSIIVSGEVVKFNKQIMGRNWVHIQDGTGDEKNYDLAITTNDMVKVGDTVTFKGKVSLNKDFGAGYYYEVIIEQANLVGTIN